MNHRFRPSSPAAAHAALAFALAATAFACNEGEAKDGPEPLDGGVKKREPTRVLVQPVEARDMAELLETMTRVESEFQVDVVPRASGMVTEILVEEGDVVVEGQVLARLDSRDFKLMVRDAEVALEEAKAMLPGLELSRLEAESRRDGNKLRFEQAQRDHDRNVALNTREDGPSLVSPKDLDASQLAQDTAYAEYQTSELALKRAIIDEENGKTAVDRARLTLDREKLTLSYMEITAPFDGVIAERLIRVGDTVGQEPAFVLTDPDNLRAIFFRPQRELMLFGAPGPAVVENGHTDAPPMHRADRHVVATAEALPGRVFRGVLERVSPTIDAQSGNFRVTVRLDPNAIEGGPGRLLPGMLVRLKIVTERREGARVVHKRALQREGDTSLVFVVRDERAWRVGVEEGLTDDEFVEVIPTGLHELDFGEPVVVVGNRDLEDGSDVRVQAPDEGGTPAGAPDGSAGGDPAATATGSGDEVDDSSTDGGAAAPDSGE